MTRTADRGDIRATADDPVRMLDGSGAGGEEVGGKAAALDRLVRWGIPVPAAACVTAAAYRAVARRPGVAAVLARLADGEQVETATVDAAFQQAGLPGDIAAAVRDIVARIGDGRPVAIRSSATVEDMAASSFAGQYDSVLDVDPHDGAAVEHAVLTVFSSLHHPAPRAYRAALGIPEDGVAMAALVMPMVPARRSGVLFTQDPTAPPGTVRIETVTGLADVLVSGKQTPRVLRLDHGTVPADAAPEIAPLLAAAREIERRAGCPQDVEWAWDGTRIWIVQARPITVTTAADDPFDSPPPEPADRELTTAGIAEMLPGVLPPLRWEVCSFLVEEALRTLLDGLGALSATTPTTAHGLLRRVHGRAALDAAATGVAQGVSGLPTHSGPAAVRHRLRAAAVRRHARFDADVAIQASGEIDARARILDCLPPHELLRYQLALIDLATRAMAAEISVAADAGAIHTGLRAVLRRYVPAEQARRLADALVVPERVISASPRASAAIPAGPTWLELGRKPLSPTAVGDRAAAFDQVMTTLEQTERWPSAAVPRWLRHRQIQRLAHEAAEQLERRERAKKAILLLGGEIRRVHLEIGRRLTARGALAEPAEVELLRVRELRPALVDGTPPAPATLAHRRRWLARQEQRDPLPQHFRGVPGPTATAVPTGRRLTGWAAGSGRFRGTARHLDAPEQSIGTDEVLVAVTTDPSWAPLLMRCGAMVIEQGGPLSHAAILAREFGVPAVFNLPGAARALDGRPVEVDGDTGIVTLLDEGPPDAHPR
ncbi:PEP-utilizing enzyme [Nocardia otitidiscaviarum]|uniref:PEP/pyruvate-binding domain-containing protein n=1 Tax=Nocardia otitidiscaviarum TaxID=1823 RepID=UPI00163DA43F|nr:PEP/pyruvate-binding domain-containing protein [Nocardia otitidiscaviarum]MCP9618749.1 PEP-utilizing enzyme [Nocardia otitidiscaviarum]